ncbi:MAG TPA: PQQ-dependent sugar dehydrogenase [Candidatus Nitrosotenuis sp.]|jgi:glucose/arabinose dehydrogenase
MPTLRILLLVLGLSLGFVPVFADEPQIKADDLVVETFVDNIPNNPTTMTFVGDDILVLQRYNGQVRLVHDGVLQDKPVLDVSVAKDGERGMLGITSIGSTVYVYFTAADTDGGKAIENRIFKYEWNGSELVNPILLKQLPGDNYYHNGGAMTNFDGQVYAVIGDNGNYGKLQNRQSNWKNDTSVILRVDPPGPYYAMGIRNSFGITFDPFTGNMWDTENGDDDFDEINLVPESFNSGWIEIMGPAKNQSQIDSLPKYGNFVYSDPEFSWQKPVAPTGISFVKSEKMLDYQDSVFVGDCNTGNLYRFKLNSDRTDFVFETPELSDKVLNLSDPSDEIIFGSGFGCVTDIELGPDGLLYIVSLSEEKIYRLVPKSMAQASQEPEIVDGGCLIATAAYGTELATQVQLLREVRDNVVFSTHSGTTFMTGFNQAYYSFSPTISDWERQSPVFREMIKIIITPMLSTLSLLNYAEIDSEQEMLGYGIGIILLNVGIYFIAPVILIEKLRKLIDKCNRKS